jgi:hypothetical protein
MIIEAGDRILRHITRDLSKPPMLCLQDWQSDHILVARRTSLSRRTIPCPISVIRRGGFFPVPEDQRKGSCRKCALIRAGRRLDFVGGNTYIKGWSCAGNPLIPESVAPQVPPKTTSSVKEARKWRKVSIFCTIAAIATVCQRWK